MYCTGKQMTRAFVTGMVRCSQRTDFHCNLVAIKICDKKWVSIIVDLAVGDILYGYWFMCCLLNPDNSYWFSLVIRCILLQDRSVNCLKYGRECIRKAMLLLCILAINQLIQQCKSLEANV